LNTLQASGARLAELDRKLAVLQEERSNTQETHDAAVERFIMDTVRRNGITKWPIGDIVAGLDRLAKPADLQPANYGQSGTTLPRPEAAFPSAQASETTVEAFVKMSNNASEENRQKLKGAGLHWSGKEGGFIGRIGLAALEQLRVQFPDRVLRPARAVVQNQETIAIPGKAELTESPSAGAVDVPGAVAESDQSGESGIPMPSNGLGDHTDAPPASTAAPRTPTSPFRSFSQRKSGAPPNP
jgi:hypothetical protein